MKNHILAEKSHNSSQHSIRANVRTVVDYISDQNLTSIEL